MTVTEVAPNTGTRSFLRRMVDVDTHEMVPFHLWGEFFGEEIATQLAPSETDPVPRQRQQHAVRPDITADVTEITQESVWNMRDAPARSICPAVGGARRDGRRHVVAVPQLRPVRVGDGVVPGVGVDGDADRHGRRDHTEGGYAGHRGVQRLAVTLVNSVDARAVARGCDPTSEPRRDDVAAAGSRLQRRQGGVDPLRPPPAHTSPADAGSIRSGASRPTPTSVLLHIGTDFDVRQLGELDRQRPVVRPAVGVGGVRSQSGRRDDAPSPPSTSSPRWCSAVCSSGCPTCVSEPSSSAPSGSARSPIVSTCRPVSFRACSRRHQQAAVGVPQPPRARHAVPLRTGRHVLRPLPARRELLLLLERLPARRRRQEPARVT